MSEARLEQASTAEKSQPSATEAATGAGAGDDALTHDPILRGKLTLWQPRVGYRFSIDPLLLADFVGAGPLGRLVDIGAGVGVVGLLLARTDPQAQVTLVELQPRLADLCRRNADGNGLGGRCTVVEGDVRSADLKQRLQGAWFDLVASCPPYYALGRGEVNPDSEEAIARHEIHLPLGDLVQSARRLVGFRGRVAFIYPSPRLPQLLASMVAEGLTPTRLRLVHAHAGEPGQRAIVEGRKGARSGLVVEPPLVLRTTAGSYTDEALRILGD